MCPKGAPCTEACCILAEQVIVQIHCSSESVIAEKQELQHNSRPHREKEELANFKNRRSYGGGQRSALDVLGFRLWEILILGATPSTDAAAHIH